VEILIYSVGTVTDIKVAILVLITLEVLWEVDHIGAAVLCQGTRKARPLEDRVEFMEQAADLEMERLVQLSWVAALENQAFV
jgi:hypothetical protein